MEKNDETRERKKGEDEDREEVGMEEEEGKEEQTTAATTTQPKSEKQNAEKRKRAEEEEEKPEEEEEGEKEKEKEGEEKSQKTSPSSEDKKGKETKKDGEKERSNDPGQGNKKPKTKPKVSRPISGRAMKLDLPQMAWNVKLFKTEAQRVQMLRKQANLLFYTGKIASVPSGDWLDNIHLQWFWDYDKLEKHHGYIQWLFPIFESGGMNFSSYSLKKEEAKEMRSNFEVGCRFLRSYRLMLNFYGMELVDIETGKVQRHSDWEERYLNLNWCSHNNLRISRILQCLGQMGFGQYKRPFLEHLETEITENGQLQQCAESLNKFWKFLAEDEDSEKYKKKTKEEPEDREPSVFFEHMKSKSRLWQKYLVKEEQWKTQLEEIRQKKAKIMKRERESRMEGWRAREKQHKLFLEKMRQRAASNAASSTEKQKEKEKDKKEKEKEKKEKEKEKQKEKDEKKEKEKEKKKKATDKKSKEAEEDSEEGEEAESQDTQNEVGKQQSKTEGKEEN
ncbi:Lethal factor domain protein [Balamuthia mandrillaris]